jgi:ABC-type sugar transport system ATPase subunit
MIELNEVYLSYTKDYNALQNINLKIEQNDHVVIFGEENSGKSSLLRVMVGLENPNKGTAYIKGVPANKVDCKEVVC